MTAQILFGVPFPLSACQHIVWYQRVSWSVPIKRAGLSEPWTHPHFGRSPRGATGFVPDHNVTIILIFYMLAMIVVEDASEWPVRGLSINCIAASPRLAKGSQQQYYLHGSFVVRFLLGRRCLSTTAEYERWSLICVKIRWFCTMHTVFWFRHFLPWHCYFSDHRKHHRHLYTSLRWRLY